MKEKYEFPRLYSWTKKAKQSVFSLFNYMENASFRGDLKVIITTPSPFSHYLIIISRLLSEAC